MYFPDSPSDPLGLSFRNQRFQTSYANSNNSYTTDYGAGSEKYWDGFQDFYGGSYQDYLNDQQGFNATEWLKAAAHAATVFGLQWILEKKRIDDRDKIIDEMRDNAGQCAEAFCDCSEEALDQWEENKPETPKAAEYDPVDCCKVYLDTISCNIQNHPKAEELADLVNNTHLEDDLGRMLKVDLKYNEKADLITCQINDLLQGRLPISDQIESAEDSCGRSLYAGSLGGSCRSRRQDLGVSELRANREGFEREMTYRSSINRDVSPLARQYDTRDMIKNPAQAMQWALLQAELVQQSLQNVYNLAAVKDPTIAARTQARLSKCAVKLQACLNRALIQNQDVVNLNAFAQPLINQIGQGVQGLTGAAVNSFGNRSAQLGNQSLSTPNYNHSKLPPAGTYPGHPAYEAWSRS